jgi:prepilin-type N-terminal cleavage/methylation domain-containing protein
MNEHGFSLLEVLLAVTLIGLIVIGVLPAMLACKDTNSLNEIRSGAAAAAQRVMEEHRRADPALLPTSGSSAVEVVTVGDRDYEVISYFCLEPAWCDLVSRHIVVEVGHGTETVVSIETVFTQLR